MLQYSGIDVRIASLDGFISDEYIRKCTGENPFNLGARMDIHDFNAIMLAPLSLAGDARLNPLKEQRGIPLFAAQVLPAQIPAGLVFNPIIPLPESAIKMGALGEFKVASPEQCHEAILAHFTRQDLAGKTIMLTAGPTIEDADPARFISNRSTGRMGTAIARMAARRGATVLLVHGPMEAPVPQNQNIIPFEVRSANDMHQMVKLHIAEADIAILCAAVADFAPVKYSEEKIKKGKSIFFDLQMRRTPDILASVGQLPDKPFLVGFAAESNNVRENAMDKLTRKNCDLLCANDITAQGCGFAVATNRLLVFAKDGSMTEIPLASKEKVANAMLDIVLLKMGAEKE